ncbi:phosphopyruvate hydratase [candidate division WWE3 bacterium RIFOXYC1_FULL_39_7]|uniref:Enolase n=2 Tax=Katanobacteria TaxID=422282 RepID=A0A1F4X737_UNCKA|nr:MAG: phosphopyruvate hydratase [candidate division WWE3 bacterium RIFOXYC1_FULL_39_7]OGC76923.1 MAG: phosphopyruvate hydratase [candidate division WWE3 bacterium RIFOXYD1_FULL_39_9]
MSKIKAISCHKILNSRGDWTIETHVELDDGAVGIQAIPEGASKGEREAVSLPVDKSVHIVSTVIDDAIRGENPEDQEGIDRMLIEMDGTANKHHFGGNSLLSVSLAVASAVSNSKGIELYEYLSAQFYKKPFSKASLQFPTPVFNVLNGGKHAHNGLSFQEFMVIPSRAYSIDKAIEIGTNIYHSLKTKLIEEHLDVDVGDEGGFAPNNLTVPKALEFLKAAASEQYKPGKDVFFGMDVAAESFYSEGHYKIREENLELNDDKLIEYYEKLFKKFEIIYLEDPFYERDYQAWEAVYKKLGNNCMIVGDDLVVTNTKYLKKAIERKMINAVIVKPNQVGTLTETFDFVRMAQEAKMDIILSHRSGDTAEDTFIADLAVAVGAQFIKSGAPVRGERVAKYNRLLEILAINNPED